jgi:hypothetical protein
MAEGMIQTMRRTSEWARGRASACKVIFFSVTPQKRVKDIFEENLRQSGNGQQCGETVHAQLSLLNPKK